MKLNIFLACIGIFTALLLGYWAFSVAQKQENDLLCGVCSVICFSSTLIPMLAIDFDSTRITIDIRVLSTLFFMAFAISHFCFANLGVIMPYYVVANGLLLLIFFMFLYVIGKTKVS